MSEHLSRGRHGANDNGWSGLFWEAFKRSRNAMALLDDRRRHVEVNGSYLQLLGRGRDTLIGRPVYEFAVGGGPVLSNREWRAVLRRQKFTGIAELIAADGHRIKVQFAGHPELVTGRHLILLVVLTTARGVRRIRGGIHEPSGVIALTRREVEVIQLIALGLSSREIGEELHVTENTVRKHVSNAMARLGARSRAQLVAKSLAEGVVWRQST